MRILVATDGSPAAAVGIKQASHLAERSGGEIRIVAVVPPPADLLGAAWIGADDATERSLAATSARSLLALRLHDEFERVPGIVSASTAILEGDPAEAIVAEALRWGADLIVVGARGHGALAAILLGSVSEEVVDRSPLPTLVARQGRLERLVVAVDGSPASRAAVGIVAGPAFRGLRSWVVDVAPTSHPWWLGLGTENRAKLDRVAELCREAGELDRAAAEAATATLRSAGMEANSNHRIGDAAEEILRTADSLGTDTIVIGTRGRTGIGRLILGSVTRKVLRHAAESVLVVPPAVSAVRPSETAPAFAAGRTDLATTATMHH